MTCDKATWEEPSEGVILRTETELDRLLGWVRAAESRLALILPLSTAMLGTLAVLLPSASKWTVAGGIAASCARPSSSSDE